MTDRQATTTWTGDLLSGTGETILDTSELTTFAVSWPARANDSTGKTSPEELIAATFGLPLHAIVRLARRRGHTTRDNPYHCICRESNDGHFADPLSTWVQPGGLEI